MSTRLLILIPFSRRKFLDQIDPDHPKTFCAICDATIDPKAIAFECVERCPDFYVCKDCYGSGYCSKVAKHQHKMRPRSKKSQAEAKLLPLLDLDLD